jgi:VWFA-related protein
MSGTVVERVRLGQPAACAGRHLLPPLRQGAAVVIAAGSFIAGATALVAQSQAPVFRAEASLVEVIVRVTDAEGRFVPDLALADFEVRDEGRVQTVVAFDRRDLPRGPALPRGRGRPVLATPEMSAVAANDGASEARLFVFFLDDIGTPPNHIMSVRRGARDFLERYVTATDLVAVFSTGGRGDMTQEFTRDKTRVLTAIDRFVGSGNDFGGYASRVRADVARAIAMHLAGIRGRRVSLVWLSANVLDEGDFYQRQALDAVRRANVTVYVVDPRRLYDRDVAEMVTQGGGMAEEVQQIVPRWGERPYGRTPDVLRDFAEKTGGFAAVNTNEFDDAFERILDENSHYYVLGYQPANRGRDGELRSIRVRVPSRPDLRISARSVYVAGHPATPGPRPSEVTPMLADALVSSLPAEGLPLRVQAVPRPGEAGKPTVDVVVEIAGRDLPFAEIDGHHRLQLEFAYRTIDSRARSDNNRTTTLTFNLTPDQLAVVRRTGLRWLSSLDLAPGAYNFRVSGQVAGSRQAGLVFTDIDVPSFGTDRLWIGGVALTSLPAALGITAGSTAAVLHLPGPPTTARTFVSGDVVTVGAGIVIPQSFARGAVRLAVHAQDEMDGAPRLDRTVELPDRATATQPRVWTLPTRALGAGQYVLRLTLQDDRGQEARTAVLFEVVEQ